MHIPVCLKCMHTGWCCKRGTSETDKKCSKAKYLKSCNLATITCKFLFSLRNCHELSLFYNFAHFCNHHYMFWDISMHLPIFRIVVNKSGHILYKLKRCKTQPSAIIYNKFLGRVYFPCTGQGNTLCLYIPIVWIFWLLFAICWNSSTILLIFIPRSPKFSYMLALKKASCCDDSTTSCENDMY